jgi:hypothetical protein
VLQVRHRNVFLTLVRPARTWERRSFLDALCLSGGVVHRRENKTAEMRVHSIVTHCERKTEQAFLPDFANAPSDVIGLRVDSSAWWLRWIEVSKGQGRG